MRSEGRFGTGAAIALALPAVLLLSACGSSDSGSSDTAKSTAAKPRAATPTTLAITTSDAGKKRFSMQAPSSIKGGLVEIRFTNAGKAPHEAQLLRIDGTHSLQEVLKIVAANGPSKIPEWFHAEGGVATTPPGQSRTTTENLPAGHYFVADAESDSGPPPSARGATAQLDVTPGADGPLPATTATIEAKTVGKDKYEFVVSGLKAGPNKLLFKNDSKGELHHVVAFPIRPGKTLADVKKALATQGKPSGPPPVDFMNAAGTEVIDGKRELVSTVNLKAGHYALVCFLNDRDGGKPHFMKGMLKEVDVK